MNFAVILPGLATAFLAAAPLQSISAQSIPGTGAPAQTDTAKPPAPSNAGTTSTTPSTPNPQPGGTTPQPGGTGAWSVQGPVAGRWTLMWDDRVEVMVTAGERGLRNVRLTGSTLQNTETGATIGAGELRLCPAAVQRDSVCVVNVDARQTQVLSLSLLPGAAPAGVYTGAVQFAADSAADQKPLTLRVEQSSWFRWFLGGLAIAAGIFLGWLLGSYLRQLNLHFTAQAPAAQLRDAIADLRDRVANATTTSGVTLNTLQTRLTALEGELTVKELMRRGFIPGKVPNPFSAPSDLTPKYREYLEERSVKIATLGVIVRLGVEEVIADLSRLSPADTSKALARLDDLARTAADPATATAAVNTILAELAPQGKEIRATFSPTTHEVLVQIQRANAAAWALWMVLTLLVGLVALVFNNYGFGTPMDYCKCILWGIGVPVAGQQLQNLAPNAVGTTFKLQVPA